MTLSSVPILLRMSLPANITGLIALIVIDSSECATLRAWPYSFEEGLERQFPFETHANATSAVVLVFFVLWIVASRFGMAPCFVFRRLCFPAIRPSMSMSALDLSDTLQSVTAAAHNIEPTQNSSRNQGETSAVAHTIPSSYSSIVGIRSPTDDRQSSEFSADHRDFNFNGHMTHKGEGPLVA